MRINCSDVFQWYFNLLYWNMINFSVCCAELCGGQSDFVAMVCVYVEREPDKTFLKKT